jgi:hypothetical protein
MLFCLPADLIDLIAKEIRELTRFTAVALLEIGELIWYKTQLFF